MDPNPPSSLCTETEGTVRDEAFDGTLGFEEQVKDACGVGFLADIQGRASRTLLTNALEALGRMAHRGAIDADGRTGDGAGVMTQIPFALLKPEVEALGIECCDGKLAVGLIFLPLQRRKFTPESR